MNTFSHGFALKFFGAVLAAWLAIMFVLIRNSALPDAASGTMLVVFEPRVNEAEALASIAASDGKIIKKSGLGFAWIVQGDEVGLAGRLKSHGALGAYRELPIAIDLAGCLAIVDAKVGAALN